MTPVAGAVAGVLLGVVIGVLGAKAINAGIDGQIARASDEDAKKFTTIRRLAGPIVIATTIVEVAVVGYLAVQFLWGSA